MARKMKDSGIEWIGEIPEGWEVSQLKYATRWKSEKGCPDAPVLSLYRDFGVVPKDSRNDNHNVTSLDTSNYKVVDIGDLVINKMKAWQGSMAVSDYRGIVSPAYHVCSITSNKVNKRYLHHLLRNPAYLPEYARLSTGMRIGQWDLGFDDFKNIPFLIPPLDEQAKIADYLDNGCASLDVILDKTRSSIEEYKKLKQAVITQAVTKGVRSEREMKDSGVEWIGEIPKEWVIQKIKSISSRINVGVVIRPSEYFDENGTVPFLRGINVKEYLISSDNMVYINESSNRILSKSQVHTDDILIVRDGSIGTSCVVPAEYDGANVVSMVIVTPSISCDSRFTCYSLNSDVGKTQFTLTKIGSALTHTSVSAVSDIIVAVPSCAEQKEIADYLDAKCAEIDGLIAKKEQLVKELENYKKSLIFEYVTGKKELRR